MSQVGGFACGICGIRVSVKNNLKRHLISQHLRQLWDCHDCGKSFKRKDTLRKHSKACLKKKNYEDRERKVGAAVPSTAGAIGNRQRTISTTDRKNQPRSATTIGSNVEWKENEWTRCVSKNELKLKRFELPALNPHAIVWLPTSVPAATRRNTDGEVGGRMPSTPEVANSRPTTSTINRKSGRPRTVCNKSFTKEHHFTSRPKINESVVTTEHYQRRAAQSDANQSTTSNDSSDEHLAIAGTEVSPKYDDPVEGHKICSQKNTQKLETLEELHIRLAHKAIRQTVLKCLPRNIFPLMQDPEDSESDFWSYCKPDDLDGMATGTSSPCKRVRGKTPTRCFDIYDEVKIEVPSSDDDCEFLGMLQHPECISSNKENIPTHDKQSLPYDMVEENPFLSTKNPQFLGLRVLGKEAERDYSKITRNELKRKIAKLRDEHDALLDQEKINEEKLKIILQRKQTLEKDMANVALQKDAKATELTKYTCLLEERERDLEKVEESLKGFL